MKNFYFIFMTCVICLAMYAGGNYAMVASWFMFVCGLSGIMVSTVYNKKGKSYDDLRDRISSRSMIIYPMSEVVTIYAVYRMIELGYYKTAFIYILGASAEMMVYATLKRRQKEVTQ